MIDISIIIPTFNRNDLLNICLASIIKNVSYNYEIIIINDYKESDVKLSYDNPNIKIVDNPKQGVASARNLGAKLASSPIVLFIDDDMIIRDFAINKVIDFIRTNPYNTYNANWVYPPEVNKKFINTKFGKYVETIGFNSLQGWNKDLIKDWKPNAILKGHFITSQFLGMSKDLFISLNGYDESYPFAGFEDYDLSKRLKSKGIKFTIDTNVCIYHNELDRLNPRNFMLRRRRGSISRKVAVEKGHKELELNYGFIKNIGLKILSYFEPLLLKAIQILPSSYPFNVLYTKSMNVLIATNIFIGYNTKH